jgi:hypothetical protein
VDRFKKAQEDIDSIEIEALDPELDAEYHARVGRRTRLIGQMIYYAHHKNDYTIAIYALKQVLLQFGARPCTYEWLDHLIDAFLDLEHGTSNPIFTPRRVPNRSPSSTMLWQARARVAVVLDLLITKHGKTREDAAREIARKFPRLKYLAALMPISNSPS